MSGLEAANALTRRGGAVAEALPGRRDGVDATHQVLPVRADETQVVLGRAANKAVMDALATVGLDSPWVR